MIFFAGTLLLECRSEVELSGPAIINKAVEVHGGELYKHIKFEFDFRGRHFSAERKNGKFLYEKFYSDSTGNVRDYLDNSGAFREVNDEPVDLDDNTLSRIAGSVNSVIYFASLPYPLLDRAVRSEYIGTSFIKGKNYYAVEVTFAQEGGGEDFEDKYVYWFDRETFLMDYFAYYFHVNGGGSRFRKIYNRRELSGITFSDHENFTSDEIGTNVEDYDKLFDEGKVKKVSDIVLENVKVEIL